jgi:hypothetical protein
VWTKRNRPLFLHETTHSRDSQHRNGPVARVSTPRMGFAWLRHNRPASTLLLTCPRRIGILRSQVYIILSRPAKPYPIPHVPGGGDLRASPAECPWSASAHHTGRGLPSLGAGTPRSSDPRQRPLRPVRTRGRGPDYPLDEGRPQAFSFRCFVAQRHRIDTSNIDFSGSQWTSFAAV